MFGPRNGNNKVHPNGFGQRHRRASDVIRLAKQNTHLLCELLHHTL